MTHTTEYIGCPDCGAPAEIVDRFVLDSTDGPLEHLKLWCVTGRWFTVLTENLPARRPVREEEVRRWTAH
jgi:hypothetical protein